MKVTLYNAISVDGYIAMPDGDTEWVTDTDWGEFSSFIKEHGVLVMGRNTYDVAKGEDWFPFPEALNIIMTSNESLLQETSGENIRFVNVLPNELLEILEQEGYGKLLVIGGGTLNASFLKEGLIDELILSVHPIILGKGIKLFENYECNVQLEEIGVKELDEGLVQIRYKVVK